MEIIKYHGRTDGRTDTRTWVGARDACASKNEMSMTCLLLIRISRTDLEDPAGDDGEGAIRARKYGEAAPGPSPTCLKYTVPLCELSIFTNFCPSQNAIKSSPSHLSGDDSQAVSGLS